MVSSRPFGASGWLCFMTAGTLPGICSVIFGMRFPSSFSTALFWDFTGDFCLGGSIFAKFLLETSFTGLASLGGAPNLSNRFFSSSNSSPSLFPPTAFCPASRFKFLTTPFPFSAWPCPSSKILFLNSHQKKIKYLT